MRREGLVPAVIYGDKKDPEGIALNLGEVKKLFNTGRMMNTLLDIEIDGKKQRAIARDVQLHPVRDDIPACRFSAPGKGAKIAVEVSVTFLNEETCSGLKQGGVLNVVRYTVELNCPADNIPETIELDLAEAEMNDSIHISEVTLPEGVEPVISDRDFTIATIAAPAALERESKRSTVKKVKTARPKVKQALQKKAAAKKKAAKSNLRPTPFWGVSYAAFCRPR